MSKWEWYFRWMERSQRLKLKWPWDGTGKKVASIGQCASWAMSSKCKKRPKYLQYRKEDKWTVICDERKGENFK